MKNLALFEMICRGFFIHLLFLCRSMGKWGFSMPQMPCNGSPNTMKLNGSGNGKIEINNILLLT